MDPIVGSGKYTYKVREDWARPPESIEVRACAVSVDSQDRVYCFNRNAEHPVVVFDRVGNFLSSWGAGMFTFPHAIRIDENDFVWLTDEHHGQFMKFTTDGQLLQTIGAKGQRSDTGVPADDFSSSAWKKLAISFQEKSVLPRNQASGVVRSLSTGTGRPRTVTCGVSRGLTKCKRPARIFDSIGTCPCLFSWGEPGNGPGQFNLPHGVWIDRRGRVLVADRENDRVQVFDQDGNLLTIWPTELIGPAFFYVDDDDTVYIPEHNGGMISILTLDGERLARWGDGPINRSCHGIWVDSHHDLYVVQPGEWGRVRRVVKYERR